MQTINAARAQAPAEPEGGDVLCEVFFQLGDNGFSGVSGSRAWGLGFRA